MELEAPSSGKQSHRYGNNIGKDTGYSRVLAVAGIHIMTPFTCMTQPLS